MRSRRIYALALSLLAFFSSSSRAQWQIDGVPLSIAPNGQNYPVIVSDGAGGAIVTWYDLRNGASYDIYAQRVNAAGVPLWTADGVAICTAAFDQLYPQVASDGAGGAIITWYDFRTGASYDVYAQRVNAAGTPLWAANGVVVSSAASDQYAPTIAPDGVGGAVIAWYDFRNGPTADVYAQRVNSSGFPQWTANGVALCTAVFDQYLQVLVSDGSGGAVVAWIDIRNGANQDIYAQRVSGAGLPQWAANGVALCNTADDQSLPRIISDNAGGAIVTWQDHRSGQWDVYVQRVTTSGVAAWTGNGIGLSIAGGDQQEPAIAPDGAGGAILAWEDFRSGANYDIYARRVSAAGVPLWTPDGVPICNVTWTQWAPSIVSDGAGGAVIAWADGRNGNIDDVYAQRVTGAGVSLWYSNGIAVTNAGSNQLYPLVASDGAGGAIAAWFDFRSGGLDIYAQRVESRYGEWGKPEPTIVSATDNPRDQGGKIILRWSSSGRDRFNDPLIAMYSVWRSTDFVAARALQSTIADVRVVSDPGEIGPDFSGAAIWKQITPAGPEYWEWIADENATYQATYSFTAPTRQDSVATNPGTTYFKVIAHQWTSPQSHAWESASVSAHSVDNLAPAAPLLLTAQRVGSNVNLKWNGVHVPDLKDYSVYRKTSTGVTPVPINFLAASNDTVLVDAGAPTSSLYYIVTAYDVHANQSAPSNEAHVSATTGVGNTPPITALTVLDNMPNPFNEKTTLRVGLPKASEVEIDVFDVAGRSVRIEHTAQLAAGWREVSFAARDSNGHELPSGVYFYRVQAAGQTITRKMVIAR
jgi:hypothetical protein